MKKLLLALFVLSGLNCLSAITKKQLFSSIDRPCFAKVFGRASDEVVESRDELGNTALLIACQRNNFEVVQALLLYSNIYEKINVPNHKGETPFSWAVYNKNEKLKEILVLYGAEQVIAVQGECDESLVQPQMVASHTLERATRTPLPKPDSDSITFLSDSNPLFVAPVCLSGPACKDGIYYKKSANRVPGVKVYDGVRCPGGDVCLNGVGFSSDEEDNIDLSLRQMVPFRAQLKLGGSKKRCVNVLLNFYRDMLVRMMLSDHPEFIKLGEYVRLQPVEGGDQYFEKNDFNFAGMFTDLRRVYLNICLSQKKNLDDNSYQQFRKRLSSLYGQLKKLLGTFQMKYNDVRGISVAVERDQLRSRC